MSVVFEIPYPSTKDGRREWSRRYGLNAYYSGKNHYIRAQDAKYWHLLVRNELRRQRIKKCLFQSPVEIRFRFNDRLDCSNHAAMVKFIEDALKGWVIEDDNRKHVQRITSEFWDGDTIHVEVREL